MVFRYGQQAELGEQVADMGLHGLGRHDDWFAIAWLDRPSAIRASTASSRSVRVSSGLSRRGRATSRETTCGSITDSPAATRRIASVNWAISATRSLRHLADPARIPASN